MRRLVTSAILLAIATSILSACRDNTNSSYIGKWRATDGHVGYWANLEIVSNGNESMFVKDLGMSTQHVASIENGMLKLEAGCYISHLEEANRLVASSCGEKTYEYERVAP